MKKNSIYEANITVLKRRFPDLFEAMRSSRDPALRCRAVRGTWGNPTLEVMRGKARSLLNSRKDPWEEAERLVSRCASGDEELIIAVGFGLGYHIETLLRKNPTVHIAVIEPSPHLLSEALRVRDASGVLTSDRVTFFSSAKNLAADKNVDCFPGIKTQTIILRSYATVYPEEIEKINNEIQSFFNRRNINTATLGRFDRLWTKNIFKNAPFFFTLAGVKNLANMCQNLPAVVICAGPSLDSDLGEVGRLSNSTILIAVDTASTPLLRQGIVPDFVVSVDPQYVNSLYLSRTFLPGNGEKPPALVADPSIQPIVLRSYPGAKVLTSSVFSPGKTIERYAGAKGSIAAGGSVAVAAFDLARILGADPIVLVGLDLSYSTGKTHLSGSFIEDYILSRQNRLKPQMNFSLEYMKTGRPEPTRDKHGHTVLTDKRLLLYRSWFEQQAKMEKPEVINAGSGGLNVAGMKNRPLRDLSHMLKKKKIDKKSLRERVEKITRSVSPDTHRVNLFCGHLEALSANLSAIEELGHRGMTLTAQLLAKDAGEQLSLDKELDRIDAQILSFKEENRLVSMVTQASISEVSDQRAGHTRDEVLRNAHKLYASIADGSAYLLELFKISRKKLIKYFSSADIDNSC
jgi:hypothetical protein